MAQLRKALLRKARLRKARLRMVSRAAAIAAVTAVVAVCSACSGAAATAARDSTHTGAREGTGAGSTVQTTQTVKAGGLTRTWVRITPRGPLAGSAPIVVVLSGITATISTEVARDGLLPFAASGQAELVYPAGVGRSWNAGGCCGVAARRNVDDTGFLRGLAARVDPGHRRPIDLVGYSNGGRLAYRMACSAPGVFAATAVVKAMPEPGCTVSTPASIVQIDSTNDPSVPYRPGDRGREHPAATTQVARLRATDGCTGPPTVVTRGQLDLETWSDCRPGTRLAFALYRGGGHSFPSGNRSTPAAASVILSFFHGSAAT